MRQLESVHERAFSARLASDARTAMAHFEIEVGGAKVYRTSDSRCHVIMPVDPLRDTHIVGTGFTGDMMELLSPLPLESRLVMSMSLFAQVAPLANRRKMRVMDIWVGKPGNGAGQVPPPRPDFEVRPVLHSDLGLWRTLPTDAGFLTKGYGDPGGVLTRGAAVGAFNGRSIVSMATANLGRIYANIWAYTRPELRVKGLATHCIAQLLDHLRPRGAIPLFAIIAENGSPDRAMARHFGLEMVGELACMDRKDIAL